MIRTPVSYSGLPISKRGRDYILNKVIHWFSPVSSSKCSTIILNSLCLWKCETVFKKVVTGNVNKDFEAPVLPHHFLLCFIIHTSTPPSRAFINYQTEKAVVLQSSGDVESPTFECGCILNEISQLQQ